MQSPHRPAYARSAASPCGNPHFRAKFGAKRLGIAVVQRERGELHLHHNAVTGRKHRNSRRQAELVEQRLTVRVIASGCSKLVRYRPRKMSTNGSSYPPIGGSFGIVPDRFWLPVAVVPVGGGEQMHLR